MRAIAKCEPGDNVQHPAKIQTLQMPLLHELIIGKIPIEHGKPPNSPQSRGSYQHTRVYKKRREEKFGFSIPDGWLHSGDWLP